MDYSKLKVRSDMPYPEIEEAHPCTKTVDILKDLISCKGGELNAILQYIYQSTVADLTDADLGELFEEAGIVSMNSTGLLMHAITQFGGLPKYEDSNGVPFNANCVNYSYKLKDMLESDIKLTQNAIDNFTKACKILGNESLKALLMRIVKDKQEWLQTLIYLKNTVQFMSV